MLEQSVLWVSSALENAEFLVVNKFGKRETEGKGLSGAIAAAVERGLPVLVGINGLNLPAFLEFADGIATELAPDAVQVTDWCLAALLETRRQDDGRGAMVVGARPLAENFGSHPV